VPVAAKESILFSGTAKNDAHDYNKKRNSDKSVQISDFLVP
jgi:hypothetical protein